MKQLFLTCVLILFFASTAFAQQQITITGRFLDRNEEGIPGVTITELPQSSLTTHPNYTISNVDGRFSIVIRSGSSLRFSFIGYQELTSGPYTTSTDLGDIILDDDEYLLILLYPVIKRLE
ncbi:MAG: hypothetical protein J6X77_00930 [Bacteroidales bacterium]|nr:hypothetical protein [Bacteroidales bacterium]